MLKKSKIKILIFLISIIIIGGYWFISSTFENNKFKNLKSLLTKDQKQKANRWLFAAKGEVNLLDTSQLEDLVLYIKNPDAFKLQ